MNQKITERIISKLQEDECTIHKEKAELKANGGVIFVSKYCCTEFYDHLSARIEEELTKVSRF